MTTRIPTPAEARKKMRTGLEAEIEVFRQRVARAVTTGESKIYISIVGIKPEVVNIVEDECEEAGWSTDRLSDPRDGNALVLYAHAGDAR